jgi:hypothetical protein
VTSFFPFVYFPLFSSLSLPLPFPPLFVITLLYHVPLHPRDSDFFSPLAGALLGKLVGERRRKTRRVFRQGRTPSVSSRPRHPTPLSPLSIFYPSLPLSLSSVHPPLSPRDTPLHFSTTSDEIPRTMQKRKEKSAVSTSTRQRTLLNVVSTFPFRH